MEGIILSEIVVISPGGGGVRVPFSGNHRRLSFGRCGDPDRGHKFRALVQLESALTVKWITPISAARTQPRHHTRNPRDDRQPLLAKTR